MKKYFLVCVSDFYYNNRIFDINSPYNRDNAWYPFFYLKERFRKENITLNTYDFLKEEDLGENSKNFGLIFIDIPKNIKHYFSKYKNITKYLIIAESIFINKKNAKKKYHQSFSKIFTYQDELVDNKKYFKLNYSFNIPSRIDKSLLHKNKLCTLIAAKKRSWHHLELYSERIKAIRWFEKNHPNDFDLYGIGWDIVKIPILSKIIDRYDFLKKYAE